MCNWLRVLSVRLEVWQGFNYEYSKEWDEYLNKMLDEGEVVFKDIYHLVFKIEDKYVSVWLGNKWYAYACTYDTVLRVNGERIHTYVSGTTVRPSIKTMLRVHDYVESLKPPKTSWKAPV